MRARCRQACEACRARKSRCLPGSSDETCKRCEISGVVCVPHEAIRRTAPQKRVRGRFASGNGNIPVRAWGVTALKEHGDQGHRLGGPSTSGTIQSPSPGVRDASNTLGCILLTALDAREPSPGCWVALRSACAHQCSMFLDRYRDMVEVVPFAIQLPPVPLDDLLSSSPILLLAAILTGSSSDPEFEKQAGEVYRHVLAHRVIVRGQKSMELLQSLLTYMLWYHHRFDPETLQYYQLLQLANGMVADLGLPRRFARDGDFSTRADEDVNAIRAFLLCFYLNCGGGVLGYDRPENMRCIESLRNAAKLLVELSPGSLDKEAPAVVELMHLVSLHRGDGNPPEHRFIPSEGLAQWRATYLRSETSVTLRSSYHFVAAYSVLRSSSSKNMSSKDVVLCVEHFEALLSNILDQRLSYIVQLGIIEWAHLITTFFLLARLDRPKTLGLDGAVSLGRPPLTHQHVGRFRALMEKLTMQAGADAASEAPHLMSWLDKILTAATQQASSSQTFQHLDQNESGHRHEESAYELVNSFLDDKGRVRDHDPGEAAALKNHARQRGEEDFWTDFMSDWLNW
ncbi:hypothetical protein CLAIMM_13913 [Cladophialophora immunda]|nr:hypothetical protein CLAIMM_13913 [Cladophialophora immunda]